MTSPKAANLADSSGVTVPGPAERLTLPQLREFVEELTRSGVEIKDAAVSVLPVSPSGAVKLQQRGPTKKNDQGAHVPESFKMAMQPAAAGRLDKNDHELGRLNAPTASPDEKVEALLFAAVRETDEEMGWKAAKAVRAALGRAMKEASDSVDVYLNWNANEGKNRLDVTFVLNLRKSEYNTFNNKNRAPEVHRVVRLKPESIEHIKPMDPKNKVHKTDGFTAGALRMFPDAIPPIVETVRKASKK